MKVTQAGFHVLLSVFLFHVQLQLFFPLREALLNTGAL